MKIITAKNNEIIGRRKQFYPVDAVTISRSLHFSKSFCIINDLKIGNRLVFMNDEKDWRFYIDNDCEDGFVLSNDEKKNGGLYIHSNGLVKMIKKSLGEEETVVYRVVKTMLEQHGKPVFWIMTDKKIVPTAAIPKKLKIA